MNKKTKIGIIGCGNISSKYIEMIRTFDVLDLVAVSDVLPERAKNQAEKFKVPNAVSVEQILADPDIEIIINLTPPAAHAEVAIAALQAGKSVYNEKPLAINLADARHMLHIARETNLRIGCAPDTVLGAGYQTCRKLIDEGIIGTPVAATAFMAIHGHESWHPDPEYYYKTGAGPLFDMGPYYLSALITLLGPVAKVASITRTSFAERVITSEPKKGQIIKVETPTHINAVLQFASGVVGNLITSFDVWKHNLPRIEIYGSEGTLSCPDPNTFGGPVKLWKPGFQDWEEIPLVELRAENSRSLGVADMATAIQSGRKHRANGEIAFHVLEVMHTILAASDEEKHLALSSTCDRPIPMVPGLNPSLLDD